MPIVSRKLTHLVNHGLSLQADAHETWQELADETPEDRLAGAAYWQRRADRVLRAAQHRAEAEGVDMWDALA
jgi:hypothetical protein